jgi:hypothetical protein
MSNSASSIVQAANQLALAARRFRANLECVDVLRHTASQAMDHRLSGFAAKQPCLSEGSHNTRPASSGVRKSQSKTFRVSKSLIMKKTYA